MLLNLALFALAGVSALANSHTDHSFESHHGLARLGLALEAVEPAAPSNSNAKERRRAVVELEERAVSNPKAARGANYYSALVAIGASYTDNAHSRSSAYAGSLRDYYPYNKFSGKYTNGKVGVEWMVDGSISPALKQKRGGVKLVDYAYGGSVIQNGLSGTGASWPAANDQIASYLSDLKSGAASVGQGRVLHYFNSGINPVSQIWNNALSNGFNSQTIAYAKSAITANTKALAASVRTINADSTVYSSVHGVDFLLVGIPQLDIVPTFTHQIPSSYSTTQRTQALSLLRDLTNQFNTEVKTFSATLKTEVKSRSGGRVFFYDLAGLWKSLHSSPRGYGITISPVTTSCYNSATGGLCGNGQNYLYFDTLHPTTAVHKIMAEKMNALVLGS